MIPLLSPAQPAAATPGAAPEAPVPPGAVPFAGGAPPTGDAAAFLSILAAPTMLAAEADVEGVVEPPVEADEDAEAERAEHVIDGHAIPADPAVPTGVLLPGATSARDAPAAPAAPAESAKSAESAESAESAADAASAVAITAAVVGSPGATDSIRPAPDPAWAIASRSPSRATPDANGATGDAVHASVSDAARRGTQARIDGPTAGTEAEAAPGAEANTESGMVRTTAKLEAAPRGHVPPPNTVGGSPLPPPQGGMITTPEPDGPRDRAPVDAAPTPPPARTAEVMPPPAAAPATIDAARATPAPEAPAPSAPSAPPAPSLAAEPGLEIRTQRADPSPPAAPMPARHLPDAVVAQIRQAAAMPPPVAETRTEITLSPAELGRVTITVRGEGDAMVVQITAERGETLDLARRHADAFERAAQEAGLRLRMDLGGDSPRSWAQRNGASAHGGSGDPANGTNVTNDAAEVPPAPIPSVPAGRLDIRL